MPLSTLQTACRLFWGFFSPSGLFSVRGWPGFYQGGARFWGLLGSRSFKICIALSGRPAAFCSPMFSVTLSATEPTCCRRNAGAGATACRIPCAVAAHRLFLWGRRLQRHTPGTPNTDAAPAAAAQPFSGSPRPHPLLNLRLFIQNPVFFPTKTPDSLQEEA